MKHPFINRSSGLVFLICALVFASFIPASAQETHQVLGEFASTPS